MKKNIFSYIILIICIMSLQGCGIVSTAIVGDITTYTDDGKELKTWKNVTIEESVNGTKTQSAFKTWGLNFYDQEKDCHVIISNAVPYIIEYQTKKDKKETSNYENHPSGRKYPEWGTY